MFKAASRNGAVLYEESMDMVQYSTASAAVLDDAMPMAEMEEVPAMGYAAPEPESAPESGYIRENFANTIAWEPFLLADENGEVSLRFTNADKLSTYYVQLFAIDRQMRNAVLRREMVVSLPVKVAIVEPLYLYSDDKYSPAITLSNSKDQDISGVVEISFYDGADYKKAPLLSTHS